MPLPVAHGFIGASIIAASRKEFSWREDWWRLLAGAMLAILPDFDLFFVWVMGASIQLHGGFTHSILYAAMTGAIFAWSAREFTRRQILSYTLAVMSHGLLDFLVKKDYGGSQLFWPFLWEKFNLGAFNYFVYYPDPKTQPLIEMLRPALAISVYEVMIFAPLLAAVLMWKQRQTSEQ